MKKIYLSFIAWAIGQFCFSQAYLVNTAAGNGTQGNIDSSSANCELYWPYNVKSDNDSVLYFADTYNNCIKKLNYNTNIVSTVAGTGSAGFQNGIGTVAMFNLPGGMFYKNGYLYVADCGNNVIRMIDLNNNNTVSTFAGSGTIGFQNGAVSTAKFNNPFSVLIEANGDMYVADYGNHCIRFISGGQVSTFAGMPTMSGFANGTLSSAMFNLPRDITQDANGDIFVADQSNHRIRKISGGNVTTFSGSGSASTADGSATTGSYYYPTGICIGASGNFYVCEVGSKVRKVDASGNVISIAGTGVLGFQDGPGTSAQFNTLAGVCYDPRGYIYLADKINNRIRRVFVADVLGIAEASNNASPLTIYPNPARELINVRSEEKELGSVEIYNSLGELIYQSKTSANFFQLELTKFQPGIFLFKANGEIKKFMKE